MRKTAAFPMAVVYAGLIVYASLFPFADWRSQGIAPWAFLGAPVPRYWTGFDVVINCMGYAPFGALLAIVGKRGYGSPRAWVWAVMLASLLSLLMESTQTFLPTRVASREDLLLNALGAVVGAGIAGQMERLGILDFWGSWHAKWLTSESRGGLVLLMLWPIALLFPAAIPFGLGQMWARTWERLDAWVLEVPASFIPALNAVTYAVASKVTQIAISLSHQPPLTTGWELVCIALGLFIPCMLGFTLIIHASRRRRLVWIVIAAGLSASTLSAAMSWGPSHAWSWLDATTLYAVVLASAAAIACSGLPWRMACVLGLVALVFHVMVQNQAPENPYFAQTLQTWEAGRFIRFNGLAQWLGWLWPYAVMIYLMNQLRNPAHKFRMFR